MLSYFISKREITYKLSKLELFDHNLSRLKALITITLCFDVSAFIQKGWDSLFIIYFYCLLSSSYCLMYLPNIQLLLYNFQ